MAFILICPKCHEHGFREYAKYNGLCAEHYIENLETVICANNQRVKELESTVLDLQSELSRKKYSLTVACNRVEELEDKLAKCQDIAMGLGIKCNEQQDKLKIAVDALRKVDSLIYSDCENEFNMTIQYAVDLIEGELK